MAAYDKVRIIGLMTMAPFTEDMDEIRSVFRSLRELRDYRGQEFTTCTLYSIVHGNVK